MKTLLKESTTCLTRKSTSNVDNTRDFSRVVELKDVSFSGSLEFRIMMMTMAKGKGASEAQDWLLLNSEVATLQSPFFKDPFYC